MDKLNNKVAFIVVGWNNKDLLEECLQSIKDQSFNNVTAYYVDNYSQDGSVEFVKKKFPNVIIIEPGTNTGFAKGNNIGIKEALSDPEVTYVALLNTDARIDSDWTKTIVDFASLKPKGALYQGMTFDYYDKDIIDSTHIFIARNGQGTQGNWRNSYVYDIGPKKVFGVNAAACIISRKYIEAQPFKELFDEQMFMYLEDVDLSTRATVMGWDNYLVRSAKAYHMGSASSGKNPGYSLYMTFRNNSALLLKNLPIVILFRITPSLVRGDIDTIKTLKRLGQDKSVPKVIKGRIIGLFRALLFIPKRLTLSKYRSISTKELWKLMGNGY